MDAFGGDSVQEWSPGGYRKNVPAFGYRRCAREGATDWFPLIHPMCAESGEEVSVFFGGKSAGLSQGSLPPLCLLLGLLLKANPLS